MAVPKLDGLVKTAKDCLATTINQHHTTLSRRLSGFLTKPTNRNGINSTRGVSLQTLVKRWFRDKESGFLDNGDGPDIMVSKADLVDCHFLKVGATVEFECHSDKGGLIAKKVKLSNQKKANGQKKANRNTKEFRFGVMT